MRLALDELHHKVRLRSRTFIEGARVMDVGDVGVPQPAEDLRLVVEPLHRLG
jgi:hypothetical protein